MVFLSLGHHGGFKEGKRYACGLTGHALKDPNVTVDYHKEKQGRFSNLPIEVSNDLDQIINLIK